MSKKTSLLATLIAVLAISVFTQNGRATFNQRMNYQGRLTDTNGVPLPNGLYDMSFRICADANCATTEWTEVHDVANQVQITDGLFSTELGGITALSGVDFDANPDHYLLIAITSGAYSGTYLPGQKITAAAMALEVRDNAIDSSKVLDNSLTAADLAVNVVSSLSDGTTTVTNDGGNIALVAGSGITIVGDDGLNKLTITADTAGSLDGLYVNVTGDTMTGSLTMNNAGLNMNSAAGDITFNNSGGNLTMAGGTITDSAGDLLLSDTVRINNLLTMTGANGDITFDNGGGNLTLAGGTISDSVGSLNLNDNTAITGTLSVTGVVTSTVATGTAPFTITSGTRSANLNADRIDNFHAGNAAMNVALNNGAVNTSLNSDMLDGSHLSDIQTSYDALYVNVTGDTMTGALTMNGAAIAMQGANGDISFNNSGGTITMAGGTITDSVGALLLSDQVTVNNELTMTGAAANITFDNGGGDISLAGGTISDSVGSLNLNDNTAITGTLSVTGVVTSTVATGTAPFTITSGSRSTNLNADRIDNFHAGNAAMNVALNNGAVNTSLNSDMLDGSHLADIQTAYDALYVNVTGDTMTGALTMNGAAIAMQGANGDISFNNSGGTITMAGGTITDSVGALLLSDDVNVSGNFTMAGGNISDSVGSLNLNDNTAITGTLSVTGVVTSTVATGTAPFTITSGSRSTNLNADRIDNFHAGNAVMNVALNNGAVNTSLNADMLDGSHLSDLQTAYDARYVNVTGDTMTGALTMSGASSYLLFDNAAAYIQNSVGDVYINDTAKISGALTHTGASAHVLFDNAAAYIQNSGGDVYINDTAKINAALTHTGASAHILFDNAAAYIQNSGGDVYVNDTFKVSGLFTSTVADGVTPMSILSTTVVGNLNVDRVDGYHFSDLQTSFDGRYVNVTGDTMTGALNMSGASSNIIFDNASAYIQNSAGSVYVNDDLALNNTDLSNFHVLSSYVNTAYPKLILHSQTTGGSDTVEQAASISLGESGVGGASLHLTYTGDGYGHIGMGAITNAVPTYEALKFFYTTRNFDVLGSMAMNNNNITNAGTIEANTLQDNDDGQIDINDNTAVTGTIVGTSTITGTQLISNIGVGTAPLGVTSTTVVANLNVDRVDDYHFSDLQTTFDGRYVNVTGDTMSGTFNLGGNVITNSARYESTAAASYDKIRVWNDANYTIGMTNGLTYGGIVNEYAMTFTMNNSATRGFLWRDYDDIASDAAMSLTTAGVLKVKGAITAGDFVCATAGCIGSADIADVYVFNSGDTMTGNLTMGGNSIYGQNGTYINMGVVSTEGFRIGDDTTGYPDIYCTNSVGNTLCEFPSGMYVTGSYLYSQVQINARAGIQNDTASARLLLNDDEGTEIGPLFIRQNATRDVANYSSITSTPNLHLDSKTGYAIYMNWYGGNGGVYVGNGASAATGNIYAGNLVDGSYNLDPAGTSVLNQLVSVANTTMVTNLNSDRVDGFHLSDLDGRFVNVPGDTMTGNLTFNNYGLGIVGTYDSYRYQNVFAMGPAYVLPADGSTTGTLYGIAWTHSNAGGQSKAGLGHQMLVMENGITHTALGVGIWTDGTVTAPQANLTSNDLTFGGTAYIYTVAYANGADTYCTAGWVVTSCMDSGGFVRKPDDCSNGVISAAAYNGRMICAYAHYY